MNLRFAGSLALISLLCSVLLGTLSCSEDRAPVSDIDELVSRADPTGLKVLLVGIDGATLRVINPMIADGKLPLMRTLMEQGASGVLESTVPMASPALWTSIATGRSREVHGIEGFASKKTPLKGFLGKLGIHRDIPLINKLLHKTGVRREILVGSNDRKISALWNWVGPFGMTTGFCGWWASWPAEPVDGWILSDRITRSRYAEWEGRQRTDHLTYWPDLIDDLRPLMFDPAEPPMNEINSLVDLTDDELNEFHAVSKPIFGHWLSVFKFAWCTQRSYENFALHMLDKGQPDLTGVFLVANDPISHTFWHFYEPEKFEGVDPEKAQRLGNVIPNLWEHNDQFLSELLTRVDSTTVVMIVSDHGFQASGIVPKQISNEEYDVLKAEATETGTVAIGQSGKHHMDGVLIACGPSIKKGVPVRAHLLDIAPTILTIMGLPVPEDMEGRVLTEIFEDEFLANHPIQTVSSFEDYLIREQLAASEDVNEEELLQRLRALGYVK